MATATDTEDENELPPMGHLVSCGILKRFQRYAVDVFELTDVSAADAGGVTVHLEGAPEGVTAAVEERGAEYHPRRTPLGSAMSSDPGGKSPSRGRSPFWPGGGGGAAASLGDPHTASSAGGGGAAGGARPALPRARSQSHATPAVGGAAGARQSLEGTGPGASGRAGSAGAAGGPPGATQASTAQPGEGGARQVGFHAPARAAGGEGAGGGGGGAGRAPPAMGGLRAALAGGAGASPGAETAAGTRHVIVAYMATASVGPFRFRVAVRIPREGGGESTTEVDLKGVVMGDGKGTPTLRPHVHWIGPSRRSPSSSETSMGDAESR